MDGRTFAATEAGRELAERLWYENKAYRTALSQIAALQQGEPVGGGKFLIEEAADWAYRRGLWKAAQIAQAALGEGEGKEVQGE